MESPKVTVLILSYNGKSLLEEAVPSYLANDYPNFEVVVVDNGSSDNTKEYVEKNFPDAKVVRLEKNRGYSGGLNFGLEYAFRESKSKYVVITNNDVKADTQVVKELVKVAETDDMIGFVTGKVYYYYPPSKDSEDWKPEFEGQTECTNILQSVGKHEHPIYWNGPHIGSKELDTGKYEKVEELTFADDIYILASRKMYEDTLIEGSDKGGYDETFVFQSEEYDWEARAKNKGYKIYYAPGSKIWHKESMTIGRQSAFKAYFDARNPMIVMLKYRTPKQFKQYFWVHFKTDVFRNSLVRIKKGLPKTAWSIWKGFFSGMRWGFAQKRFTWKHFF